MVEQLRALVHIRYLDPVRGVGGALGNVFSRLCGGGARRTRLYFDLHWLFLVIVCHSLTTIVVEEYDVRVGGGGPGGRL